MNRVVQQVVYAVLPDGIRGWLRYRFGWKWFRGNFTSWAEAKAASTGYDEEAILKRVIDATRQVHGTLGLWERDGVVFDQPISNEPLIAALGLAAVELGRLEVLDFGGSLGSTWWQHRASLTKLGKVRWIVVEQPHFVGAGREFQNDALIFMPTIEEALKTFSPNVVLLSGVLPYLPNPRDFLRKLVGYGFSHIVLDRMPLIEAGETRLAIQHTPPDLGGGKYPIWLLTSEDLMSPLMTRYRMVDSWPALDRLAPGISHHGFHFEIKR